MWALQRLRKLLTTEYGQSININRLLGETESEARSVVRELPNFIPKAMVIYNIVIVYGFKLCSEVPLLMKSMSSSIVYSEIKNKKCNLKVIF